MWLLKSLPMYIRAMNIRVITGVYFLQVKNKPWIPKVYTWIWHRHEHYKMQFYSLHASKPRWNYGTPTFLPLWCTSLKISHWTISCNKTRTVAFFQLVYWIVLRWKLWDIFTPCYRMNVSVRYHSGGSMKLNVCILLLAHMVYL